MCGIAGQWSYGRPIDIESLKTFTNSMRHRGPDGVCVNTWNDIGLGHCRLSILDLSEKGKNPLCYRSPKGKEYWIVFNGEVFNFVELKRELELLGHQFYTHTDTEVIVAAYSEWGQRCQTRFNGMWAFAIWCNEDNALFLSRDRFGEKGLYFIANSKEFAFASEIKAFFHLSGFQPMINEFIIPTIVDNYTEYECDPENVILKGVQRLSPGECMHVNSDRTIVRTSWWKLECDVDLNQDSFYNQIEEFRSLFLDAVKIRTRSDVPIATSLSGGVDSSGVFGALHHLYKNGAPTERASQKQPTAFICDFKGTTQDETAYAVHVANYLKSPAQIIAFDPHLTSKDFIDSFYYDDDITGTCLFPIFKVYQQMRELGFKVSIDGHGADEAMFGYSYFSSTLTQDWRTSRKHYFERAALPSIMRNFDRASMRAGVEVRSPLLDYRLIEFINKLPLSSIIGCGYTKRIFRHSISGLIPDDIAFRKSKTGYRIPIAHWFNREIGSTVRAIIESRFWRDNPFWDGRTLGQLYTSKCNHRNWDENSFGESITAWRKLSVALWYEMHIEKNPSFQVQ